MMSGNKRNSIKNKAFPIRSDREMAAWLGHIETAKAVIEGDTRELWDSAAIQELFKAKSRTTAVTIMRRLGAELVGTSLMIHRRDLLAGLQRVQRTPAWQSITYYARTARPRVIIPRIALTAPLPPGVQLSPKCITIRGETFEEIFTNMMLLAQQLTIDEEAIRQQLEVSGE